MPGGVRSLRAMFEQKGDSLPDRGRSPVPSTFGLHSPSNSPSPLPKVRTSFVAVKKDGRIGIKREPSGDSISASSRRHSNETEATTPQPLSERTDVFADNMSTNVASSKPNLAHEAIPESPRLDTPVKLSPKKEEQHAALMPNANPDKITDEEEPQTKMLTGDPTDASATRLGGTVLNEGISDALNGTSVAATSTATSTATSPEIPNKDAKKEASKSTAAASKTATKTARPAPTAKAATATKEPAKTAKPPVARTTAAASSSKRTAATTKATATKPVPIDRPTSSTGFVKPKPKSPTRPVKLPASLTTHTAASAQKFGNGSTTSAPRQSLSRASGNAQHLSASSTTHRSASRNSASAAAAAAATANKTLKHRASTANISRSRPSLGPPPKPAARDPPAPKRESNVDESFLARMMRPTQSSSHKTADKAPAAPPRKQVGAAKKPEAKPAEKNGKKVPAKIQAPSTKAQPAKETIKPAAARAKATAKEIAPAVAQTETAQEAIKEATLSTETAEPALVEEQKTAAGVTEEPTAKDIATAVALAETAEEVIGEASLSNDTAVPALVEENADATQAEEQRAGDEPVVEEPQAESADTEQPSFVETPEEVVGEPESRTTGKDDEETLVVATETPVEEEGAVAGAEPTVTTEFDTAESNRTEKPEPVSSMPVMNEDHNKVEDIEDVVQESKEASQPEATELTAESQQPVDEKTQAEEPGSVGDLKNEHSAVEATNGDVATETP